MAGAGYKLFNTGDVLTAAQVNTYLMEQTVMVFADAAARTTALSGVVSEGMISYLKDTNAVEVYNGSAWVASDDPNAIQNTIVDAKGDLIAASAADTPARLAVGNNGETLVADSSATTGLRWQSLVAAGRNFIINGGMDVWQRGTTGFATTDGTYTADRWRLGSNNTTVTRDTDVPTSPYFTYSLKMVGTAANSIIQRIESANSTLLAGQTVTFSFYAKRTAGTGNLDVRFYYPSATDNFASVTQIGSTQVVSTSPSSSWTRYSVTLSIGTNITTGLMILINNDAGAGSTTFITGCQLEIGSVATPFSRAGGTLAGELAACQRYFVRFNGNTAYAATVPGYGYSDTTTVSYFYVGMPVTMRVKPSSVGFANLRTFDFNGGGAYAISAITVSSDSSPYTAEIAVTHATANTDRNMIIQNNNNTGGYIELSAEL